MFFRQLAAESIDERSERGGAGPHRVVELAVERGRRGEARIVTGAPGDGVVTERAAGRLAPRRIGAVAAASE